MHTLPLAVVLVLCSSCVLAGAAQEQPLPTADGTSLATGGQERELWSLDAGWTFALGAAGDLGEQRYLQKAAEGFSDRNVPTVGAQAVRLPHDWAVDLAPVQSAPGHQAFKPLGFAFPATSVGWYWRTLTVPATYQGRRVRLRFDGIYRDARIWLNGQYLGAHEAGYTSFTLDISDLVRYGERNALVVRVDASQREGWWYEGAGIYRNVWLEVSDALAIAPQGVVVRTVFADNRPQPTCTVMASVQVENDGNRSRSASVQASVLDAQGHQVAAMRTPPHLVGAGQRDSIECALTVQDPVLWSTTTPTLYTLVTRIVTSDAGVGDQVSTRFGFRTIAWDADRGFLLNGQPVLLKGVCMHADFPAVGTAMTKSLHDYRIGVLRSFGCNAIRMSHGPADPAFMDACDEAGMLVMAETRAFGSSPYALEQLDSLIERDRNHPCVIIWSIGNEENELQDSAVGQQMAQRMVQRAHALDPTRPTTMANNASQSWSGVNAVVDVHGWNYGTTDQRLAYHAAHPTQPTVVTEDRSGRGTRGVYLLDPAWMREKSRSAVEVSYHQAPNWRFIQDHPWLSGWFLWTGFDYAGEVPDSAWPILNSSYGVVDRCGFWKDLTYGYAASWNDRPLVHLLPHWTWPGREGSPIRVVAVTNATAVELRLNGVSLGRKPVAAGPGGLAPPEWRVPYAPGTLEATAYDGSTVVATDRIETTGRVTGLHLAAAMATVPAQYGAYALISAALVDAQGRTVPTADTAVTFSVAGPATLTGVSGGSPFSHDRERSPTGHAFNGRIMAIVQASPQPGAITITAHAAGLADSAITVQSVPTPTVPEWP